MPGTLQFFGAVQILPTKKLLGNLFKAFAQNKQPNSTLRSIISLLIFCLQHETSVVSISVIYDLGIGKSRM